MNLTFILTESESFCEVNLTRFTRDFPSFQWSDMKCTSTWSHFYLFAWLVERIFGLWSSLVLNWWKNESPTMSSPCFVSTTFRKLSSALLLWRGPISWALLSNMFLNVKGSSFWATLRSRRSSSAAGSFWCWEHSSLSRQFSLCCAKRKNRLLSCTSSTTSDQY